jgi:hypothetical protein
VGNDASILVTVVSTVSAYGLDDQATGAWRERRYSSYSFLTSALEVVSVMPWPRFSPGERIPGTHCTGGWVGPRAGLDTEVRGKTLLPLLGIKPQSIAQSSL